MTDIQAAPDIWVKVVDPVRRYQFKCSTDFGDRSSVQPYLPLLVTE
jgi:hypothetical protein